MAFWLSNGFMTTEFIYFLFKALAAVHLPPFQLLNRLIRNIGLFTGVIQFLKLPNCLWNS